MCSVARGSTTQLIGSGSSSLNGLVADKTMKPEKSSSKNSAKMTTSTKISAEKNSQKNNENDVTKYLILIQTTVKPH